MKSVSNIIADREINKLANLALEIGLYYKIKLDFSNESIKKVEEMLFLLHEDYKKTKKEEGYRGIAIEFAAYIVKTIENTYAKGRWERNHKAFGEDSFPYYLEGDKNNAIFPYWWCQKRLFEGEGDNVWIKYKFSVIDVLKKKKKGILSLFNK